MNSGCYGYTSLACEGTSTLSCQNGTGTVSAYGSITLTDNEVCTFNEAKQTWFCPATQITLTINGVQVSYVSLPQINSTSVENSEAAAAGLATAIDNAPSLVGVVAAGSSVNVVEIIGSQGSTDPATLDLYPWSISLSNACNGVCPFSASLAPLQTMGTRPPL